MQLNMFKFAHFKAKEFLICCSYCEEGHMPATEIVRGYRIKKQRNRMDHCLEILSSMSISKISVVCGLYCVKQRIQ